MRGVGYVWRSLMCVVFTMMTASVAAQQLYDNDYYPYAEPERLSPRLVSDTALFWRAVALSEAGALSNYSMGLPRVRLHLRGAARPQRRSLGGVQLSNDYTALLGRLRLPEVRRDTSMDVTGWPLLWTTRIPEAAPNYRAQVAMTTLGALGSTVATAEGRMGTGCYAAAVEASYGRDLLVEGCFNDGLTAGLRVIQPVGRASRLDMIVALPLSMEGLRAASTEECFTLTHNALYNPAWGFQNGRMRNSRVRRALQPMLLATCTGLLSPKSRYAVTVTATWSRLGNSLLGWYDAATPMPDNYHYLPSYLPDDPALRRAWERADSRYTQIPWDELIRSNRLSGGPAHFAVEERIQRRLECSVAAMVRTDLGEHLEVDYGLAVERRGERSYKQLRDLLGASYLPDVDYFLVDDRAYASRSANDLRHPNRRARRGDRFSYDYSLHTCAADARVRVAWLPGRWQLHAEGSLGRWQGYRVGHMEKQLFPGAGSYGRSARSSLYPYAMRLQAHYLFTLHSRLSLALHLEATPPEVENLYYQPLYNNLVAAPTLMSNSGFELRYRRESERVRVEAAAYLNLRRNEQQTRRYYDDLAGLYADCRVRGIDSRAMGVEAATEVQLSRRWRARVSASAGDFRYVSDPLVTVLCDRDNAIIEQEARSHMADCRLSAAPAFTAAAQLQWQGRRGWGVQLSAGWASKRYIEPAWVRRTSRMARACQAAPELQTRLLRQASLGDAFTTDVTCYKHFRWVGARWTARLRVSNITGYAMRYYGYESPRLHRLYRDQTYLYAPHADRYTNARPRTYTLSLSWHFR